MSEEKEYLRWWLLLKHLKEFASVQPELEGVDVRAGAKKPKDPYPCVEFVWDDENGQNLLRTDKGQLTIWVSCWIKNSAIEPEAGSAELNVLMNKVCTVIVRWTDAILDEKNIFVDASVSGGASDGDANRPVCGSIMLLKLDWKVSE